jgi:hypothetical protein
MTISGKVHCRTSTAARARRSGRGRTSGRVTQQRRVARSDRQHPAKEFQGSMQAGARPYPDPSLPACAELKRGLSREVIPPEQETYGA